VLNIFPWRTFLGKGIEIFVVYLKNISSIFLIPQKKCQGFFDAPRVDALDGALRGASFPAGQPTPCFSKKGGGNPYSAGGKMEPLNQKEERDD
jgi:hypothetical protein